MKTPNNIFVALLGLVGAALVFTPNRAMAQAAPGPLPPSSQSRSQSQGQPAQPAARPKPPEVPARTSLAGAWRFNSDQSDDPRQKVRIAEGGDIGGYPGGGNPGGGYPGGGYPGGGYPGGGYPRGPWGGGGYPGGRQGPRNSEDIEGNPRIQSLIHPATLLVVDLKNPEIDITDDRFRKLLLYTDGRPLQKNNSESREEVAAHWNGTQLASDEKSPLGGKMSRTFELSQDGRQLYETLHIDHGRSRTPLVIRYVYDAATNSEMKRSEDSDPNRPVLKRNPDAGSTPPK